MHVVQALARLSVGGSELVTTELAEHLTRHGHEVTVLGAQGPLSPRAAACGASLLDWPVGKKRLSTLKFIGRFRSWLEKHRPDIVHAHSRLPAWVCWRAIRGMPANTRPAFITSMHGQYTVSPYSAVMARGDAVIAVSDHIRRYTLKNYSFVDPGRLHVVHGGTSRHEFRHGYRAPEDWFEKVYETFPELAGKRWLLLPGRLSRYKGHEVFLELVAALKDEFPGVHGVIVGDSKPGSRYRAELEGLAERNRVLDRITFTGLRDDMRNWMASSELVFNLCSDPPEAFGRTVPEALHLGVPVLAWDHGGVHEVLEKMFPEGAVTPDSLRALETKSRKFLRTRPPVAASDDFLLEDSMDKTMHIYQAVRGGALC
ncbi:MAG: glycosyltransferase [Gammaproteobacteria bacterium]|nr:glycosyltransferase [Gammaproteobacteria bacterium]NNE04921.1 glycosyltransferase [Xanthomonadales bacterium]